MSKQTDTDSPRPFPGFQGPNFTQVPDQLFDELLSELNGSELKVLLYIIRRTFGFKRDADAISLSQMLSGIVTRDGRRLDRGAGLTKKPLLKALKSLEARGVIVVTRRADADRGHRPSIYALKMADAVPTAHPLGGETPPRVGADLPQGVGGDTPPSPRGRNSTKQETGVQETEEQETGFEPFEDSKLRRASALERQEPPASTQTSSDQGPESVGDVLAQREDRPARSRPRPETGSEEYQRIQALIIDRAREFNDTAPLKSSTTRAWNLYERSGLSIEAFSERIFQARALTQEATARISKTAEDPEYGVQRKSKMPYFFAVLEDHLGLADPDKKRTSPRQSPPSRSDGDDYRGFIQT